VFLLGIGIRQKAIDEGIQSERSSLKISDIIDKVDKGELYSILSFPLKNQTVFLQKFF